MHEHIINAMVEKLQPALKSRKKAQNILEQFWSDKMALIWDTEDVHRAANEAGMALTNPEARDVLKALHQQHNAQYGLRWQDLTDHIQEKALGRKLTRTELSHFIEKDQLTIQRQ
jgi:hypothetical protein